MRPIPFIISSVVAVFFGVQSFGSLAEATEFKHTDRSVCYAGDAGDNGTFAVRLNVRRHSPLTTRAEQQRHEHPIQTTYTAVGKVVFFEASIFTSWVMSSDGSVIVAKEAGALMGLTTRNLSANGLVNEENGTAFWQCRARAHPRPHQRAGSVWEPTSLTWSK